VTDKLTLAQLPVMEEPTEEHLILWEDAVPLEPVEVDGHKVGFTWFHDCGVDRLSTTIDEQTLGVIEKLDSSLPRLLPGVEWAEWLAEDARTKRVLDSAKQQWRQRDAHLDSHRSPKDARS
jgi:hypothetical protein